jgi:methylmalonyl-CoA/ethylmalonyl-CoA epimerase
MIELPCFWFGAVFDHVGIAVQSVREAAGPAVDMIQDPVQRVTVAFVDMHGLRVELIEPLGAQSPITAHLGTGQPLLHLCFRVPNLRQALAEGRAHGMHALTRPVPAPAFDGRCIAWVFSRQLGLIELVEDTAPGADLTCA